MAFRRRHRPVCHASRTHAVVRLLARLDFAVRCYGGGRTHGRADRRSAPAAAAACLATPDPSARTKGVAASGLRAGPAHECAAPTAGPTMDRCTVRLCRLGLERARLAEVGRELGSAPRLALRCPV